MGAKNVIVHPTSKFEKYSHPLLLGKLSPQADEKQFTVVICVKDLCFSWPNGFIKLSVYCNGGLL